MRKLMVLSLVMLSLLMLPAMASATHFSYLVGMGDCHGYVADAGVHFRSNGPSMDFSYTITLTDNDGIVVETITDSMVVLHDGDQDIILNFSGLWTVDVATGFTVMGVFDISAAYPGGLDEDHMEFSNVITCTVDAEAMNFDSVKSMYR